MKFIVGGVKMAFGLKTFTFFFFILFLCEISTRKGLGKESILTMNAKSRFETTAMMMAADDIMNMCCFDVLFRGMSGFVRTIYI